MSAVDHLLSFISADLIAQNNLSSRIKLLLVSFVVLCPMTFYFYELNLSLIHNAEEDEKCHKCAIVTPQKMKNNEMRPCFSGIYYVLVCHLGYKMYARVANNDRNAV